MQRCNQPKSLTLYPICPKFAYIDLLDNENKTICITEGYIEIRSPCIELDYLHDFIMQILIWLNGKHTLKKYFINNNNNKSVVYYKSRVPGLHVLFHIHRLLHIYNLTKIQMFSWYSARLGRRKIPSRNLFSTKPFESLHAIQTESLQLKIK